MQLYPKIIMDALATVTYAGTKKNLVESQMVADTPAVSAPSTEGKPWRVKVVLEFPRDTDPFLKSTVKAAEAAIRYHCKEEAVRRGETFSDIEIEIVTEFKSKPRPEVEQLLPGVKNIIAVSSGKGGRRQVHCLCQSRHCIGTSGLPGRTARYRHLRSLHA